MKWLTNRNPHTITYPAYICTKLPKWTRDLSKMRTQLRILHLRHSTRIWLSKYIEIKWYIFDQLEVIR